MNYSFEYIDIILLAMIAGFIFLRLRGILGRRTGHEENINANFEFHKAKNLKKNLHQTNFDEEAKNNFLKGAKIAYENIIADFANGNLKNIKSLLDKKVFDQFNEAIKDRKDKGYISNTTFIGINSASIKEHKTINNILSGDPQKIKKVYDTWKFSKDIRSENLNWLLIDTQT